MGTTLFNTYPQMEDCLKNIIKLSRTTCDCVSEGKPDDFNEGQSEVYLDELEGINLKMFDGAEDCSTGGLWELMEWAREEGTKQFKADLLSCIGTNYEPRRPAYSGLIGQSSFTGSLALTQSIAGIKIAFPQIYGGAMKIKRIGLAMNSSVPITVNVFNNDANQTTPIASYVINSSANQLIYATLSTPLELPMWSQNVNRLEYYFVYDRSGSLQPKDNKTDCGCGGVPPGWKHWILPYGIQGDTISNVLFTTSNRLNGIMLDVDFRCEASRLICSDEYPFDFNNNGWDMQIAYAIRWKAGALLLQKMLDSTQLNRYTMMEREKTYGMRNHAIKMYNDFITYLCDNKQIASGCLMCKNNPNFHMSHVLA